MLLSIAFVSFSGILFKIAKITGGIKWFLSGNPEAGTIMP
jgi:hypothetical protein